jgi:hypothetical protein
MKGGKVMRKPLVVLASILAVFAFAIPASAANTQPVTHHLSSMVKRLPDGRIVLRKRFNSGWIESNGGLCIYSGGMTDEHQYTNDVCPGHTFSMTLKSGNFSDPDGRCHNSVQNGCAIYEFNAGSSECMTNESGDGTVLTNEPCTGQTGTDWALACTNSHCNDIWWISVHWSMTIDDMVCGNNTTGDKLHGDASDITGCDFKWSENA